ncbi:MAG: hypothetical protein A2Z03_01195 [Chloroflexi bacterium RBG_16_56_8]|nr:MAG: hypothetical protein A2Z03_01195 [Chloroflexi bacterium RBG_16_56_8]
MKVRILLFIVIALVALAACAPAPTAVPTPAPTAVPPTQAPPPPPPTTAPTAVPPTQPPPTTAPTAVPATKAPPPPTPAPTSSIQVLNQECLSCHGSNKDMVMTVDKETVPIYVDAAAYAKGKHDQVGCVACHTNLKPTPPHNAKRTYGSWARFSVKSTDVTKTRNFYTVDGSACVKCHSDAKYAAFFKSEHATIKDLKMTADGKPRVEIKKTGTDGKEYILDENYAADDCQRCHIATNCATCHWKTTIKQKQSGSVLDLWTKFDKDSDTAKGAMTEYGMDWTVNVASHEFVGAAVLTKSNDVCQACHIGYYQGDKSIAALNIAGIGVRRHPQVQELQASAKRGVHETQQICVNCHKDVHEMVLKNTEHGAREGGKTQCVNCHADKAMKGPAHKTVTCIGCHDAELTVQIDPGNKMVYPLALKHSLTESWPSHNLTKEVKCEKCHTAGNKVGASEKMTPAKIH